MAKNISHNEISLRRFNPTAAAWNQRHRRRVRPLRIQSSAATAIPCGMNCDWAILHCCSFDKRWNKELLMKGTKICCLKNKLRIRQGSHQQNRWPQIVMEIISRLYMRKDPSWTRGIFEAKHLYKKCGVHRYSLSFSFIPWSNSCFLPVCASPLPSWGRIVVT